MGKRIWQYPEVEELSEGDVILLDSPEEGSRSIPANKIGSILIDKEITERGTYNAVDDNVNGYKTVEANIPYTDIHVASGPIATFEGEDLPLKSLTASIVPVQAGSGDPSPTNVRPISGWTEEVISVRGKNKVDGGTLTPSASNTYYSISPTLATGDYVLSFDVSNLAWTNLNNASFAWTKDSNNTQKDLLSHSIKRVSDNAYLKDLTQPVTGRFYGVFSNVEIASLVIACRNNTYMYFTSGTITNIQLESGSTPSDFEPYAGTTTTIPFTDGQGQSVEVFGGSVDVVNGGKQPRTMKKEVLDENDNWTLFSYDSSTGIAQLQTDNIYGKSFYKKSSDNLCNIAKWIEQETGNLPVNRWTLRSYNKRFVIAVEGFSTVEEWKTYLQSNPITFIAELATPTTFYTQPTSIKSLDGENNVSASTGDVDVEYQTVWRGDTIQTPRYRLYNEEYISVQSDYDNSIQISWDNGSYVGCSLNGIIDLSGKGFKKLKYDVTFGSKNYDSEYSQNIRPFIVGVTDQIYNQYIYANQDNVASYFKAHDLYDVNYLNQHVTGEVDISKVSGQFYLLVVATGWNVKINSLVLE